MVITVDGPTASGKSTVAALLAQRLGFFHLSSGFLFRALGYLLAKHAQYNEQALHNPKSEDIERYLDTQRFQPSFDEQGLVRILFDRADITDHLKARDIAQYASILGTSEAVRSALNVVQRSLASSYNLIVDGRDSGSVVFPDALVKFFLTASLDVRAKRWQQMHKAKGTDMSLDDALEQVETRDKRDSTRAIAPLVVPEGAIVIDNSDYTIDETVDAMESYVTEQLKKK